MTQSQMTAYLADRIGISRRQAKSALDELVSNPPTQKRRFTALGGPRSFP